MSKHKHGFHSKAKNTVQNAVEYLVVLFLIIPGVLGFLGLAAHAPLGLVGGLLTVYYLVAIVVTVVGGMSWISRFFE